MYVPLTPFWQHSSTYGPLPVIWTGAGAPTATNNFAKAAVGSIYIRKVSASDVRTYVKRLNTPAASDWMVMGSSSDVGFVPIPLDTLRELTAGQITDATGNGGLLASNTTPTLQLVNTSTDLGWRVQWAAANVDVLSFNVVMPPDFDQTGTTTLKLRANMGGATNTPTIAVDVNWNEGTTKRSYATGNLSATVTDLSVALTTAHIPAAGRVLSGNLTPGAHGTDALNLYAAWIEYTRK